MTIMANEIQKKGLSIFDNFVDETSEIIINVEGKNKYCVIPFEEYENYRKYKLEQSYKEVKKDISNNNYHTDTQKHFENIEKELFDV